MPFRFVHVTILSYVVSCDVANLASLLEKMIPNSIFFIFIRVNPTPFTQCHFQDPISDPDISSVPRISKSVPLSLCSYIIIIFT